MTPPSTPAAPSSPATELAPNTVLHEAPPAPIAPQTPEIPTDYRINTLENGDREVTLNSGQVYRGSPEQVINELAKAQYNASRHITDLKSQIPAQPLAPVDLGPQIDPTAKALADLTAQGMGFRNAEEYMARLNQVETFTQQQQLNQVAANFIATTPDYPVSPENADKIDQTLSAFGLPATPDALKMVHNHLKATGQYVQVPISQQVTRSAPMPMPPNGQQAPTSNGPVTEDQIWSMSPQEFAAYEQRLRTMGR